MSAKGWALSILAVPVVYVLSLPPIAACYIKAWWPAEPPNDALYKFFHPYRWLQRAPAFRHVLEDYERWWYKQADVNPEAWDH